MTDILVRVPASEAEHFWEDVPEDNHEWWTMGRKPVQFLDGDFIFFALGPDVVAYAADTRKASGRFLSDDGREWFGEHIIWPATSFRKLAKPIPLSQIGLQVPRGYGYCGHTQLRQLVAGQEP